MRFGNLKIGTRLYLGFGAMIGLLLLLAGVSYLNFSRLNQANQANLETYRVIGSVDRILQGLTEMAAGTRGYALTGKADSLVPFNRGQETFSTQLAVATKLSAHSPEQLARLQRLLLEKRRWVEEGLTPIIEIRALISDNTLDSIIALEKEGRGDEGMERIRTVLGEIDYAERKTLSLRSMQAEELNRNMSVTLIAGALIAAVLGLGLTFLLTRNIVKPLRKAVAVAALVAKGDLTGQFDRRSADETGQLLGALQHMNSSLGGIVAQVREGTQEIANASDQIAVENMQLSARTEQQAGTLRGIASSMTQLESTVKQNAGNAQRTNLLAGTVSDLAAKGGAVVSEVVTTMSSINSSAQRIVDIIAVIDGLAFQTNILALNAAVEAARAGDQGRGFAVVAAEVRTLAQRSAAAAKEIKTLIMDSVERVGAGGRLVDQAGATMEQVVISVEQVSGMIAEIADATDEQRKGIEQVGNAIAQLDQVTQENSMLVGQAAAAADGMRKRAAQLASAVDVFRLVRADTIAAARSLPDALPSAAPHELRGIGIARP